MAKKKSAEYPYQWPDGTWHSSPKATQASNDAWGAIAQVQNAKLNGTYTPLLEQAAIAIATGQTPTEGPPPPGTYDPTIDYNAGAANRGLTANLNDAQTAFDQGQENYGLDLGDLTRGRDYSLADLLTSQTRLNQDYGFQSGELGRQFGILGRQQAEGAAQRGVTSAGLLGKSNQVRAQNQAREQSQLDLGHSRGLEDIGTQRGRTNTAFDQGKTRLDLGNSRQFGGFNGTLINNPLTGRPYTGSLATGTQRAFTENDAYQGALGTQRVVGAQANGYVAPLTGTIQDMLRKIRGY